MAALAAGALTAGAQNVYSLNIVGYVNATVPNGYAFLSNPLDNGDNDAALVLPNPNVDPTGNSGTQGPWDGSSLQTWTGVKWNVSYFDSITTDTTTGFTDAAGNPVATPILTSGVGFLVNNESGAPLVNTFVGTVRTGTNVVSLASQVKPFAIGSPLPYSGGVSTALGMSNPNVDPTGNSGAVGPLDGCFVETLKTAPSGAFAGYKVTYFDSITTDTTTGFTDAAGNPVAEPQIAVAGGFFLANESGAVYPWTQILNP